jgi:hypothetical protein
MARARARALSREGWSEREGASGIAGELMATEYRSVKEDERAIRKQEIERACGRPATEDAPAERGGEEATWSRLRKGLGRDSERDSEGTPSQLKLNDGRQVRRRR